MENRKILIITGDIVKATEYANKWISEDIENRLKINIDSIGNIISEYSLESRKPIINGIELSVLLNIIAYGFNAVLININDKLKADIEAFVKSQNSAVKMLVTNNEILDKSDCHYEIEYINL